MKKTKWQVACVACQILFMFIAPCVIMWVSYGNNAFVSLRYKVSLTGVAFVLLFFFLSKRFWLDDMLKKMAHKIANIETDALSMTNQEAIATAKRVYKRYRYVEFAFKMFVPLILLVGLTIIIKALEEQALKMYAVFLWSTISFGVGAFFKILEIKATRFIHEKK